MLRMLRNIGLIFIGVVFVFSNVFASTISINTNDDTASITSRKSMITNLLHSRVFNFSYQGLSVFIDAFIFEPRGKMQGKRITLSSKVVRDSEFLKLFIHEFGHFIDIYVLQSINGIDNSSEFYGISWKTSTVKRSSETLASFVSGYALTNQYEDFAESLVFYIFHNRAFEDRAMKNDSLRQKYLFFQKYLFTGGAFTDTDFTIGKMPSYSWDTTKIPISLQKYLYSLK